MVNIKVSMVTRYGQFMDAFRLPDNHGLTKQEITQMKIERRDRWVESMRKIANEKSPLPTPPVAEEPTGE